MCADVVSQNMLETFKNVCYNVDQCQHNYHHNEGL